MTNLNYLFNRGLFSRLKTKGPAGKEAPCDSGRKDDDLCRHALLIISRDEFAQREAEIVLVQRVRTYFTTSDAEPSTAGRLLAAAFIKPKSHHPMLGGEEGQMAPFEDSMYPEQTRLL